MITTVDQFRYVWHRRCPEIMDSDYGKANYLYRYKKTPCCDNLKEEILKIIDDVGKSETIEEAIEEIKQTPDDMPKRYEIYPTDNKELKPFTDEEKNQYYEFNPYNPPLTDDNKYIWNYISFIINVIFSNEDNKYYIVMEISTEEGSYLTPPFIY